MCFFLIYPALQRLVLSFDGAGRLYLLATIVSLPFIIMNISYLLKDPVYDLLLVITGYMMVNGVVHGTDKDFWEWMYVVYPVILMTLAYCNASINYYTTISCVAVSLSVSVFLMVVLDSASTVVELDGRLGNSFNANDIGLDAAFCLVVLALCRQKDRTFKLFSVITVIIAILAIFMSMSRTALGILVVLVFAIVFRITRNSAKYRLIYLLCSMVLLSGAWAVTQTTRLGQRLVSTSSQAEEANYETGTMWDIMGDRGLQYVEAAPYIANNLTTGIGLANWRKYSPRDMVFHSEYLVQLCENGIVCFIMYICFLIALLVRILRSRSWTWNLNGAFYVFVAIWISIIFTDFMFWTYDRLCIYCVYGIILSKTFYEGRKGKVYVKLVKTPENAEQQQ